ncbi:MAG: DUF882 domain-containing protein [Cryomorphaceae bacterium]|nr:DUF882 domain-containing protein [Cryomorphaceae bacterium]
MELVTPSNFSLEEYLNNGSRSVMPANDRILLQDDFFGLSIPEQQRNLNVLHALQPVREKFGEPIFITCGYRSKRHEMSRGRSGNSQHLFGAIDITCDDMFGLNQLLHDWKGGYNFYEDKNFIHIDLGNIRRW